MPTSLVSTGVQFPDNSIQTVAATTANTTNVLSATAGASADSVGTYTYAIKGSAGNIAQNGTIAGSALTGFFSGSMSGTWRNMGVSTLGGNFQNYILCLRIS